MTRQYSYQALETIARNIIKRYDPALLAEPRAIPIEDIVEKLYGLRIEYQYIRNNGRVLGETIFDDTLVIIYDRDNGQYSFIRARRGTVIVDASLFGCRSNGRLHFTLAHELAHWVIHYEIYAGTGQNAAMMSEARKSSDEDALIERQADRLSTALLMPSGQVKMAFYRARNNRAEPVAFCAEIFEVSRQAMKLRLNELRLT